MEQKIIECSAEERNILASFNLDFTTRIHSKGSQDVDNIIDMASNFIFIAARDDG